MYNNLGILFHLHCPIFAKIDNILFCYNAVNLLYELNVLLCLTQLVTECPGCIICPKNLPQNAIDASHALCLMYL